MEPTGTERESFAQLLLVEWNNFQSVRGWMIGMVIAALVTVAPGLLIASGLSCQGPNGNACPAVPLGPDGGAVTDRFYFVHQSLTADGSITVRVTSMTGIITYPPPNHDEIVSGLVPWAKAGVIIKENIQQGSAYAAVSITGSHGARMQYNFPEDIAGLPGSVSAEIPRWLRLVRSGDSLTGYESADGIQWTKIGIARLSGLPATVQIGLFVTSPCDLTISEGACRFTQASADFDQISLEGNVSGVWSRDDVGDTPEMTDWERYHRANGLVESGSTFTVTGTGDIAPLGAEGGWTVERILIGAVLGLIVVIIVAVLFATADTPRGMKPGNQPVVHQSDQVLLAKATVIGMVTFVVGSVSITLALLWGKQILLSNGNTILPVSALTELRVMFGTAALLAVVAIFAIALGALIRRRVLAIIAAIVVIVLPLILSQILPLEASQWVFRVTPAAGFAIQQSIPEYPQVIGPYVPLMGYYPLVPWAGMAVACAYTALLLGLAIFRLRRNDV